MILQHLDKNNLHHAYLIEGDKDQVLPLLFSFLEGAGIRTTGNPDFSHILTDNFKIEEALNLKAMSVERSTGGQKKVFVVSTNQLSLDAQHALLKLFEEPTEDTLFFMIMPDVGALLGTFVSRFYVVRGEERTQSSKTALRFLSLTVRERIEFLKDILVEPEDEIAGDSVKRQALRFLNDLEKATHDAFIKRKIYQQGGKETLSFFNHMFRVREFLRQPGSSAKNLLESVALLTPVL